MAQHKTTAPATVPTDPQLRRMLATHIHCGEKMEPVHLPNTQDPSGPTPSSGQRVVTYRCFCGFCFDETPN